MSETDRAIRAITDDGSFRVIVLSASGLVAAASATQEVTGEKALRFGELLIGATLIRQTMSPAHRVQLVLKQGDQACLVADSHPDGVTRGLAPSDVSFRLDADATLEVMRTVHGGRLHRSIIAVSQAGDLSSAVMTYLQSSEQVVSMLRVVCEGQVEGSLTAGGYIVQLLPEANPGLLAVMTERLADFPSVAGLIADAGGDPRPLLEELLYAIPYTVLEEPEVRFGCNCSLERVVGALATLGRDEIQKLVLEGEMIELGCDYCGSSYPVTAAQIQGLVDLN